MSEIDQARMWEARFAAEDYVFGTEPNVFLAAQAPRLKPGWKALALADGEGRNGVWLAGQGLEVVSSDLSPAAQAKAARLAAARGVALSFERLDLASWTAPEAAYDVVAAIFIQFAGPALRQRLFEQIKAAVRPGGLVLMQGYRPEQLAYGTGGPPVAENLYDEAMLRQAFAGWEILELRAHDSVISEGSGHSGMSALINLVARRPG